LFSLPISLFSTTYTAVLSGDWTSAVTWGGMAPPTTISDDDLVIISANVTVNMDTDVELNNQFASINILGNLESQNNLTVTSGTVLGTGTLIVNELMIAAEGTVIMTGEITCETFETASNALTLSASVNVNSELILSGGICQLDNSGSLMLASDATIQISGGKLQNLGGTLTADGSFNLLYSGGSTVTGDETTAGTINNLTVNLSANDQTLTMDGNLTIAGTLSLMTGTLDMSGFDLTLEGNSEVQAGASLSGNSNSSLILSGSGDMGVIVFTSGEEDVKDCTVNIENGGWVSLGSNLTVNGTLSLNEGNVIIGDNNLTINANGSIEGGSENSFVLAQGEGSLIISLEAGGESATFPVGTDEGYFPCILTENEGADNVEIAVNLAPQVYAEGESGADLTATESLVANTWFINSTDANAQVDLDFEFMWHSDAEVNGFSSDNCYISHYINGSWDVVAAAQASVEANGYLSITRENITSLSPFRVADNMTAPTFEFSASEFHYYPNPAKDYLIVELPQGLESKVGQIFSANGKLMGSYSLKDNTQLDISNLPAGHYILKLHQA
ncbi:MAG: T9SS C-terminal target domain-containing protein, partial [Bacteroidetes bacterium]